jgi:mannose-1-phosphate guanylyltransferase
MVNFHNHHGKEGTICVTKVENPSRYGVVLSDENHCIKDFIEKPKEFISDKINAGIYLFKTSIIDRIPLNVKTSIERKIFPVLA